ncbi:hypothetical protein HPP92_007707 [Vanilla planifolia]|uniref:Protein PHLOEM PROTEIN 2-LIKE A10 n=1 Tax=Vanilla planifolia TaxID=51239 RepID=A0A835RGY5_VANPL|nr:hypothetical protein HPP92_007707 [Vanilla planifolia]
MAHALAGATLDFSRRRRRWILFLAAAGLSGYGAYRVYHMPSVVAKRRKVLKFFEALVSVAEAVSLSADTVKLASSDLNQFLRSNSDEIPQSLKQIAKVARSEELAASFSILSEALTVGIIRGLSSVPNSQRPEAQSSSSFSDKLLETLFSNKSAGFASVVVGSFARNMVMAFYSSRGIDSCAQSNLCDRDVPDWVNVMCSDKCRGLIADSIQLFVSTAVTVYLDKIMEVNTYDEFFSGLSNPKHKAQVEDMLVSVCNGAVETLVKTSHGVLTNSTSGSSMSDRNDVNQVLPPQSPLHYTTVKSKECSGGWVDHVSSVLAVPSNRQFVIDVTGRVTFESIRSFLEFLMWWIHDSFKSGINVFREEVVERCKDVMRYMSAKTMLVFGLCLALCMRVAAGPKALMAV